MKQFFQKPQTNDLRPDLEVCGYKLHRKVAETKNSIIFFGCSVDDENEKCFLLKFIRITELNEKVIKNEVSLLKKINHPNVIKKFDDFEYINKYHCIVMEIACFGSLVDFFNQSTEHNNSFGCSEKAVAIITIQILDALKFLHGKNIWHRDLKLENILVFNDNLDFPFVKIADFGLATEANEDTQKERVGTFGYVAPEVISGNQCMYIFYIKI